MSALRYSRGLPDTRAAIWRANPSHKFDLHFHKGGWTVIFVVIVECLNNPLKYCFLFLSPLSLSLSLSLSVSLSFSLFLWRLSTHGHSLLFEIALIRFMFLFNNSREQFCTPKNVIKAILKARRWIPQLGLLRNCVEVIFSKLHCWR